MPDNTPRTGLFVDVQNIYYTTRDQYGRGFNYRAFWQSLTPQTIAMANAYAIAPQDDSQHKFQTALTHIGFNVKRKPYLQRADGSAKGDWDVGITLDVVQHASQLDVIYLLSGDGDFAQLLDYVHSHHNCHINVVSVEALTSRQLMQACDHYQPITPEMLL